MNQAPPAPEPISILLEVVRLPEQGTGEEVQRYQARARSGEWVTLTLSTDAAFTGWLATLAAPTARASAALEAEARSARRDAEGEVSRRLGSFLGVVWKEWARELTGDLRGRPVVVTVQSDASDLHELPFALLPLSDHTFLASREGVVLRHAWTGTTTVPPCDLLRQTEGRVLLAWSHGDSEVPIQAHAQELERACRAASIPFEQLEVAALEELAARLVAARDAGDPVTVLHLLCHGAAEGKQIGLVLGAPARGVPVTVATAREIRLSLRELASSLRLVVLCACRAGSAGGSVGRVGSVAQAFHEIGIPSVVASTSVLAFEEAEALTRGFYEALLVESVSVVAALACAEAREPATLPPGKFQLLQRHTEPPEARPVSFRPFSGERPMSPRHARFMGGWDAEIAALQGMLEELEGPLLLTGPSGCGKSSLLSAGLAPELRKKGWSVEVVELGEADEALSGEILERLVLAGGARRLLVLDGVEVALNCPAARQRLAAWVEQAAAAHPPIRMLFALHASAEPMLRELGPVGTTLAAIGEERRMPLGRPGESMLREAVAKPAEQLGLGRPPAWLESLIEQAAERPGALPLLAGLLADQSRNWGAAAIVTEPWDGVGEVARSAQERTARCFEGWEGPVREEALRILARLTALGASIGVERCQVVPRGMIQTAASGSRSLFDVALAQLVDHRLVVLERGGGEPCLGLAHEGIADWPPLRAWTTAQRELLLLLQRLDGWARDLGATGRLRRRQLRELAPLLARHPHQIGVQAWELVHRSQEAERAWVTRLGVATALTAILAVLAVTFAFYADHQKKLAKKEQTIAQKERDTAKDALARAHDTSLVLLAREHAEDLDMVTQLLREVKTPERTEGWARACLGLLERDGRIVAQVRGGHGLLHAWSLPDGDVLTLDDHFEIWRQPWTGGRGVSASLVLGDGAGGGELVDVALVGSAPWLVAVWRSGAVTRVDTSAQSLVSTPMLAPIDGPVDDPPGWAMDGERLLIVRKDGLWNCDPAAAKACAESDMLASDGAPSAPVLSVALGARSAGRASLTDDGELWFQAVRQPRVRLGRWPMAQLPSQHRAILAMGRDTVLGLDGSDRAFLWRVDASGAVPRSVLLDRPSTCHTTDIGGEWHFVGTEGGVVRVIPEREEPAWTLVTGAEAADHITSVAYLDSEDLLAASGDAGCVWVWDWGTRREATVGHTLAPRWTLCSHPRYRGADNQYWQVRSVSWVDAPEPTLVVAGNDRAATLWALGAPAHESQEVQLVPREPGIDRAWFSPRGRGLAVRQKGSRALVVARREGGAWEGVVLPSPLDALEIQDLAWAPDGDSLAVLPRPASGAPQREVLLLDLAEGGAPVLTSVGLAGARVYDDVEHSGAALYLLDIQAALQRCALPAESCVEEPVGVGSPAAALSRVVAGHDDLLVLGERGGGRLWRGSGGALHGVEDLGVLLGLEGATPRQILLSPSSTWLGVLTDAPWGGRALLLPSEEEGELKEVTWRDSAVAMALREGPPPRLAVALHGGQVRYWDGLQSHREPNVLPQRSLHVVQALAFTDDGVVLAANRDGTVASWDLAAEALRDELWSRSQRCMTPDLRQEVLGESPEAALAGAAQCGTEISKRKGTPDP